MNSHCRLSAGDVRVGSRARINPRLLVLPALLCMAATAPAQEPDTQEAPTQLEAIEVKASPFAKRAADELVQPVDVLAGEALERKRAGNLGDTLSQQLGVSTTYFGPGSGRPIIRGQGGPRVMVLENGVGSMDASVLSDDHAVTVDPAHAQQIEIIRGPATLLYGSGAVGGLVNVVDDRMTDRLDPGFHGSADLSYGDNADERNARLHLDRGGQRYNFHLDGALRRAGDYDIPGAAAADGSGSQGKLANSFVETESGAVSLGRVGEDSFVGGSVSLYNSRYGIPKPEAPGEDPTVFIDLEQVRADAEGRWDDPFSGFERLRLRAGVNDYRHTEFEDIGMPGTRFNNREVELRAETTHGQLAGWQGTFGAQLVNQDFEAVGEEAFVPPVKSNAIGIFAVEERTYGWGQLQLGVRVEPTRRDASGSNGCSGSDNPDRSFTPLSVSAGTLFEVGEHAHLRLNASRAQRSPVTEELYACGPHFATISFERGNPDLDPETANNVELSLDRHEGRWTWTVNVFYNRVTDYLFRREVDQGLNADGSGTAAADGEADRVDEEGSFTGDSNDLLLLDQVQADAEFYGAEAQTQMKLLSYGPIELDVRLFADMVRGRLVDDGNLPRMTPTRVGIGFDGSHGPFDLSLELTRADAQDRLASLETQTDGYSLLSADLGYTRWLGTRKLTVYLRGRNLLDEEVRTHTSFLKDFAPQPGRAAFLGMRVEL